MIGLIKMSVPAQKSKIELIHSSISDWIKEFNDNVIVKIKDGDFIALKDTNHGKISIGIFSLIVFILIFFLVRLFFGGRNGESFEKIEILGNYFDVRVDNDAKMVYVYYDGNNALIETIDGQMSQDLYRMWIGGNNYDRVLDSVCRYVDVKYNRLMVDDLFQFIFDKKISDKLVIRSNNKLQQVVELINKIRFEFGNLYVFLDGHSSKKVNTNESFSRIAQYKKLMGFIDEVRSISTFERDGVKWIISMYHSGFEHIFNPFCEVSISSIVRIVRTGKNGLKLHINDTVIFNGRYDIVDDVDTKVLIHSKEELFCFYEVLKDIRSRLNEYKGSMMVKLLGIKSVSQDSDDIRVINEFMRNLYGYGAMLTGVDINSNSIRYDLKRQYRDMIDGIKSEISDYENWFDGIQYNEVKKDLKVVLSDAQLQQNSDIKNRDDLIASDIDSQIESDLNKNDY